MSAEWACFLHTGQLISGMPGSDMVVNAVQVKDSLRPGIECLRGKSGQNQAIC